jgi:hypothetical protein
MYARRGDGAVCSSDCHLLRRLSLCLERNQRRNRTAGSLSSSRYALLTVATLKSFVIPTAHTHRGHSHRPSARCRLSQTRPGPDGTLGEDCRDSFVEKSVAAYCAWTEHANYKFVYFNEADEVGYFATLEHSQPFFAELPAAFRSLR